MLSLPKTVGYALHALCCVEKAAGKPVFVREIAERTGIKKPYLAQIVNQLVHDGLLSSKRGYRGGIVLNRSADRISLLQIVKAIQGDAWIPPCFFGLDQCPAQSESRCPAHSMWQTMRIQMESTLQRTTLAEVTQAIESQLPLPATFTVLASESPALVHA